jgi:hypothetical protein
MATRNQIKELQVAAPRGIPLDSRKLESLEVSRALAYEYVKSGWLKKLGRGVFMFAGDELKLNETLAFLEPRIPGLHVAAKTALAWHGFRHNLAAKETTILWGNDRFILPEWFQDRFPSRYSSAKLFDDHLPADTGIAPMPEIAMMNYLALGITSIGIVSLICPLIRNGRGNIMMRLCQRIFTKRLNSVPCVVRSIARCKPRLMTLRLAS